MPGLKISSRLSDLYVGMRTLVLCLGVSVARLFQPAMQGVSLQALPQRLVSRRSANGASPSFRHYGSSRAVHGHYPLLEPDADGGVVFGSFRLLLAGLLAGGAVCLRRRMSFSVIARDLGIYADFDQDCFGNQDEFEFDGNHPRVWSIALTRAVVLRVPASPATRAVQAIRLAGDTQFGRRTARAQMSADGDNEATTESDEKKRIPPALIKAAAYLYTAAYNAVGVFLVLGVFLNFFGFGYRLNFESFVPKVEVMPIEQMRKQISDEQYQAEFMGVPTPRKWPN